MVFLVETDSQRALGLDFNEDRAGFKFSGSGLWCWVIDGGTSIDPSFGMCDGLSSGEWIAETLSTQLAAIDSDATEVDGYLACALKQTRDLFFSRPPSSDWPAWALPVGAISLCHVSNTPDGVLVRGVHLGDCPTFVIDDGVVHTLFERDTSGIETRTEQSLAVRKAQMIAGRSRLFRSREHCVLTLWDECLDAARYTEKLCSFGSRLLLMTDGISRIWESYRIRKKRECVARLAKGTFFPELMQEARRFESEYYQRSDNRLLKYSDDATYLLVSK